MAPDNELRLGLSGRALVFPGGTAWCLICGRRPFSLRTAAFKDPDYAARRTETANLLLQRVHPLLAWVNKARLVSFKIDAPVCFRHYWRGRGPEVTGIALLVAVLTGLVWLGMKGRLPAEPNHLGSIMKGLLVAVVAIPGFLAWRWGRTSPLLPCEARREGPDQILLIYGGKAPKPPAN